MLMKRRIRVNKTERDDRCHDREIDTDISVWTLLFDVTWKK